MSAATGNRWMDWKPKAQILRNSSESEPTKPTKPGFDGFEGATSGESQKIETASAAESASACDVLNRAGVRIMALDAGATIGVWSDLDGREIRAALRALEMGSMPVRYLDGSGIPVRYKERRVAGEPVPINVLAEMERRQVDPMCCPDPIRCSDPSTERTPCNPLTPCEPEATFGPMKHEYPWTVRDRMLAEMGWCPKRPRGGQR
jgi:hypothetical protein